MTDGSLPRYGRTTKASSPPATMGWSVQPTAESQRPDAAVRARNHRALLGSGLSTPNPQRPTRPASAPRISSLLLAPFGQCSAPRSWSRPSTGCCSGSGEGGQRCVSPARCWPSRTCSPDGSPAVRKGPERGLVVQGKFPQHGPSYGVQPSRTEPMAVPCPGP